MINVIIADDHPVMLDGIKSVLKQERNIKIIAVAGNGPQLLEQLKSETPDIVILDANLNGMSGLSVAKIIKEKHENIKILFLSQFEDSWLIKKCLEYGAKGYLLKNISKEDLIYSINKVVEGDLDFFIKSGKVG